MGLLFTVVAATLLISAFCSLFEATLYSTRLTALEAAKTRGRHQKTAALFLSMKANVSGPTSAILILNTVANTAGATIAGMLAARELGGDYVPAFSVVFTLAILLFAEIVPKTYGAVHWRVLWPYVAWPLTAIQKMLRPLVWSTQKFAGLLVADQPASTTTDAEVLAMIQLSAKSGGLTPIELELLTNVLHFDDVTCRQVMVPRNDVVFLDKSWPFDRCIALARKTQHTRYPVCGESFDAPIGILHVKDLIGLDGETPIDSVMRPLRSVPETMSIPRLLREMQSSHHHMAVVVDEHGSTVGIVTLENVLEQIVGTVQDEFDDEEPDFVPGEARTYVVRGLTPVTQVNRRLGIRLPCPGDVDTLSGLLVQTLGRLLKVGDNVEVKGVQAQVVEVVGNRATKIRITLPEPTDDDDAPESIA